MSKFVTSIKNRLLERSRHENSWLAAYAAFEFARKYHTGTRKDNTTPEFHHQLSIVSEVINIKDSELALLLVIGAFLHDVSEDYQIHKSEIKERFGEKIAGIVETVTKKFGGVKKDIVQYYNEMAKNPHTAIIKGYDRLVNIESMNALKPDGTPVFGLEKQMSYMQETNNLVIPMLKEAQKNFPEYHDIYNSIIQRLRTSMNIISSFHVQIKNGIHNIPEIVDEPSPREYK